MFKNYRYLKEKLMKENLRNKYESKHIKNEYIRNLKSENFSIVESFTKFEIDKIKEINSNIDIEKFESFYVQLQDLNLLKIPEDFQLSITELYKEKVSELLSKIRDSFPKIKSVDLVLYLETLISMNSSNSRQASITPIQNYDEISNIPINIIEELIKPKIPSLKNMLITSIPNDSNKFYDMFMSNKEKIDFFQPNYLMSFSEFLLEKKIDISFDKENLIKFVNIVIDSLFKVNGEISEEMISNILFKNKKNYDSILLYRMLDAINDIEKNPYEFFYCLAISNCHTIKNLKNIGELNAREIRFIANSIKANPEKYKISI